MFPQDLQDLARSVLVAYRGRGWMLATAESCTGGMIAGCLTEIAGSSDVVDRGFVTYSNEAKHELIGVPTELIAAHGAVSEAVARAMADGALIRSRANASVAVTGVAGPGGGTADKPVGLVHLACALKDGETMHRRILYGNLGRSGIRTATVRTALEMLLERAC